MDGNHERQSTANNGCHQNWGDQICGCGLPAVSSEAATHWVACGSTKDHGKCVHEEYLAANEELHRIKAATTALDAQLGSSSSEAVAEAEAKLRALLREADGVGSRGGEDGDADRGGAGRRARRPTRPKCRRTGSPSDSRCTAHRSQPHIQARCVVTHGFKREIRVRVRLRCL